MDILEESRSRNHIPSTTDVIMRPIDPQRLSANGMLSLVNNTITVFQTSHKLMQMTATKKLGFDPTLNKENMSEEDGDPIQKVKMLNDLSAQEILNSVNDSISKISIPKIPNIWEHCCNEVAQEFIELNKLLEKLKLPPSNYKKEKSFPWEIYEEQPHLTSCHTKDFLDFYIFPFLLPAVHSLLDFAKENRVFQCRYMTFNSIDYIIEHLYNTNPLHPERLGSPLSVDEIAYQNKWQSNYPRLPLPNWLTMSQDIAAIKIQRAFRGFMVRMREDVSEMRQFWKDYKNDLARERQKSSIEHLSFPIDDGSLDDVHHGHDQEDESQRFETHSEVCLICSRYREFFCAARGS